MLLDVSPKGLLQIGGDRLSSLGRRALERFRYGPGIFKLDWALSGPVPWDLALCREAVTVHVGGTFEEVARSEADANAGRHCERPFCIVAVSYTHLLCRPGTAAPWRRWRALA